MKKILTLTTVGALLTAPAMAAKKCAALPYDGLELSCFASGIDFEYGPNEFSMRCTNNLANKQFTMYGVATCSNTPCFIYGGDDAPRKTSIYTSQTKSENKYCWCKITSPIRTSTWFHVPLDYSPGTNSNICDATCAAHCQEFAANNIEEILYNNGPMTCNG